MQTLNLRKKGNWKSSKRTKTVTVRASELEVGFLDSVVASKRQGYYDTVSRLDVILKALADAYPIEFEKYCAANDLEYK